MAITGGIACGKSRVGACLVEKGIPVCEADELAHAVLAGPVGQLIIEQFGSSIIGQDGGIDRRALGTIVFSDERKRRQLEALVHPEVVRRWTQWLQEQQGMSCRIACAIVPLLFEGGFHHGWDVIVSVVAGRGVQIERMKGRGLTEKEASARLDAQMAVEEKMKRSDIVIVNEGDVSVLDAQIEKILWRVQKI